MPTTRRRQRVEQGRGEGQRTGMATKNTRVCVCAIIVRTTGPQFIVVSVIVVAAAFVVIVLLLLLKLKAASGLFVIPVLGASARLVGKQIKLSIST